jgi:putative chitinase
MEEVRELLGGHPIHVDSWYRCAELNHAVGSKGTSAHPLGFAVDFICPVAGTPVRLVQLIQASRISFDQVIQEGSWVHISFAPARRRQVLTARFNPGGETTYTIGVSNA